MSDLECETTDVVICGCGPTGAMLSAYLGQMGVPNIVLEKGTEITTDPRGIALDEDGIRLLQGLGLYSSVYSEIGTSMYKFRFIGGTEPVLDKKAFIEMDYGTTEGGTGHVGFICHKQPALERCLRDAMAVSKLSELRSGCEITGLSEDEKGTVCEYKDINGGIRHIRSRFFIGADGKTGFTRKQYLEPKGILMEQAHRAFYEETWVALNWEISLPNEKTHPEFPLWKLGYTPEQIYDLFFPCNFRFICNPDRPAVCGRFGLPSDRLWRFEFVIDKGEDGHEMSKSEAIKKVVFPYITHAGTRYGLTADVMFPEDCIKVLRSRPFNFSARSCNRWSHGRVVLCGDAAHVFPPFGGQGIASGFRDAVSLAWRLALLCRNQNQSPRFHETILAAWYTERKQQLEKSLASTIVNGEFVTERNPLKIFARNIYLWLIQLIPAWRHELSLGRRKEGMVRYEYSNGLPFLPEYNGGLCLPQIYCKDIGRPDGEVLFTDDVIFGREKKGLFQILVYIKTTDQLPSSREIVADVDDMSKGEIRASEATFLIEGMDNEKCIKGENVYRLATGEEFARSLLCDRRPAPKFYDLFYLAKELKGMRFVIVRQDRFIFAACDTKEDLRSAIGKLLVNIEV
ncbi:hypothetical protein N7448_004657 [Penicillium atrosanguineum]|uniref:uncharacterized protein n=1 Tax=Penicillium atrosanguineum TaxID=1132637 RepID=UPI00239F131C|nr:uncharacterized protein N7443_008408 [Penicillium atrosanguineum]KAJ5136103.1 hypothetical protein N7448_004657 [Penicillium atrosanguineum]KAJ5292455.1 hypothetical protein N7443_008408 [Penicillium atrosanguineum]